MPLTLNDTIELLKAILEECGIECIVLIINLIVACRTVLVPSFNAIKTHGIAFALANSTSKCKITKCFCKSTPLVLRNSISFLVSH